MKVRYFKGLFKTHSMRFISMEKVSGDYILVKMQAPYPIEWEAGQHGAFTFPGKKFKGRSYRAFSFANAPTEETFLIGTRTGTAVSGFKQTLMGMQEGGDDQGTRSFWLVCRTRRYKPHCNACHWGWYNSDAFPLVCAQG